MSARWWAFGLWAAVAASAVYWGLKLFVPPLPVPANAALASVAASPRGDLTRLFGAEVAAAAAPAAPQNTRFDLVGVVAARSPAAAREGLALIVVDGKPARTYRVGAVVEDGLVLQSVSQRGAELGPAQGAVTVSLEMPPPEAAATGVPGGAAPGAMPVPRLPMIRPPQRAPGAAPGGALRLPMGAGVSPQNPVPQLPRPDAAMRQQQPPQQGAEDVLSE